MEKAAFLAYQEEFGPNKQILVNAKSHSHGMVTHAQELSLALVGEFGTFLLLAANALMQLFGIGNNAEQFLNAGEAKF